jgi:hypothetical protein
MLTYTLDENHARIITLLRNERRRTYVFTDHWFSLHQHEDIYPQNNYFYFLAHDYVTGKETDILLEEDEFKTLKQELERDSEIAANFKKALKSYTARFEEERDRVQTELYSYNVAIAMGILDLD